MASNSNRQPVPAGGAPLPSAIEAADATPPASNDGPNPPAASGGEDGDLVEARVLIDHDGHAPNDILRAPAAEIERLKLAGVVDDHEDAVAYAKKG